VAIPYCFAGFIFTIMLSNRFQEVQSLNPLNMRFTAKAVLADHVKRDGTQAVYLRAIIDRRSASVALGFCIKASDFDQDRGYMRKNTPNEAHINLEIAKAISRANEIYLEAKYAERYLTPEMFRREFIDPSTMLDFIQFMEKEIELRRPRLEPATYGSHITTLGKLKAFRKKILFHDFNVALVQEMENFLIKKYQLKQNTVHKVIRTIKVYLHEAERKEIKFKNPFDNYKVKSTAPLKPTLSFDEVKALFTYYHSKDTPANHTKVLRYFLFSCTTGVRISDIDKLEWNHLHDTTLIFVPFKTRKLNRSITVPLLDIHLALIPEKTGKYLFDCFAMQVTNRRLKEIAKACKIKKHLTYHVSRHTFATEFMSRGGQLDTLQQLLGHSMITTTMQYVKVNDTRKREEMNKAFLGIDIPAKSPAQN
jgi:site-specific recombinase XerD